MVKLSFKMFGCLTVFLFMGGLGMFMAMSAVVPAPRISNQVRTVVYPLAVESSKVKFQKILQNMNTGYPRQTLVFTELEANAFLDRTVENATKNKYKNFPIKNPYIYFFEDTMRVRFDLALNELFYMLANQFRGMTFDDNLEDLANRKSGSSRVSFTIDMQLFWIKDHPQIKIKKAYIGVMPLPFLSLLNGALDPVNNWFAKDFGNSSKLDNFAVRRMKFADKEFAVDMETMVTPEYQKGLQRRKISHAMSEKANPFSNYLGASGPCSFACTEKEKDDLVRAVEEFNKQSTLETKQLHKARRIKEEFVHSGK